MIAPWPKSDAARQDPQIEARFARFQEVLRGVREIRSRQNIPPTKKIEFAVRCEGEVAELLAPMEPYFEKMAAARATGWGPDVEAPALSANVASPGLEVFVDLAGLIDVEAEIAKKTKELEKLDSLIVGKEKKLGNENFVSRAPEPVVQKERDGLKELEEQRATAAAALERLRTA